MSQTAAGYIDDVHYVFVNDRRRSQRLAASYIAVACGSCHHLNLMFRLKLIRKVEVTEMISAMATRMINLGVPTYLRLLMIDFGIIGLISWI